MSECNICYNSINENKLIKNGCCSFNCCLICIKKIDKCPQCKEKFFWMPEKPEQSILDELQFKIILLNSELQSKENNISLLAEMVSKHQQIINNLQNQLEKYQIKEMNQKKINQDNNPFLAKNNPTLASELRKYQMEHFIGKRKPRNEW